MSSLDADPEIAIAIRYLRPKGASHSHIYLYRENGKLSRQLTHSDSGQDTSPVFSADGSVILFTRQKPDDVREFWSINPRSHHLAKLEVAPDWYSRTKNSSFFTDFEPEDTDTSIPADQNASPSPPPEAVTSYRAPDGSVELILREDPSDEEDQYNLPGHGKHFLLRDLKTGTETEFGKLPGFFGVMDLLHEVGNEDRRFLFDGALRLAFCELHLNSTDGDTVFALDLTTPHFVQLSPNWAAPFPLTGEAAFLTLTENRYVPIPGSTMTANCSYVEHWDAKLNRIRYAREGSAAVCYGASIYRAGYAPAVINLANGSPRAAALQSGKQKRRNISLVF
jgi:hypothetical protein